MADQFLSLTDRQQLAKALANIYDLQMGPGVRASFLKAAGLGRFVTAVNLAAEAPRFFATELVTRLEPFGMLPPCPASRRTTPWARWLTTRVRSANGRRTRAFWPKRWSSTSSSPTRSTWSS